MEIQSEINKLQLKIEDKENAIEQAKQGIKDCYFKMKQLEKALKIYEEAIKPEGN